MSQRYCKEHDRLLEFVGLISNKQGCFLCVSFGELRGEEVEKIKVEENIAVNIPRQVN